MRQATASHPWLVRLGEWSFAFYLLHALVMRAVEQTLISHPHLPAHQGAALAGCLLAVSLGLSAAAYRLIEVPARRHVVRATRWLSFWTCAKRG